MKRIIQLAFSFTLVFSLHGQNTSPNYKVVTFMTNQAFYLNGGARAMFGGKSRTSLMITLPPNTVEWYYAFTTTPNKDQNKSIELSSQLLKLVDPSMGLASTAISSLIAPTGAGVCDIYLVKEQSMVSKFISKEYERPAHILSGSRENYKNGVVSIKDAIQGTYFLAFKNPSGSEGININVEVVAIVVEKNNIVKSASQQKAELYGNLGWKAYEAGNYSQSLDLSKKAIAMDSTLSRVQCNIALLYLVTNKPEATDEYIKAIDLVKKSGLAKQYFEAAIKDIDDARKKGTLSSDADLIRSLLLDEFNSYSAISTRQ